MLTAEEYRELSCEEQQSQRLRAFLVCRSFMPDGSIMAGSTLAFQAEQEREAATPVAWVNPADAQEVARFVRFMDPGRDYEDIDMPRLVERAAERLTAWIDERAGATTAVATAPSIPAEPDRRLGLVKVDSAGTVWTCANLDSANGLCWTDGLHWKAWRALPHPMRDPQTWELVP